MTASSGTSTADESERATRAGEAPRRHRLTNPHPAIVAGVLTLLCLPLPPTVPTVGDRLDSSWMLGLSLAAAHGNTFGSRVVFTYGPLGFLSAPNIVWLPGTVLGLLYVALAAFALYYFVYRAALEWLPVWGAIVVVLGIALAAARIAMVAEIATLALLAWAVLLVRPPNLPNRLAPWIPVVFGAAAAVQFLVKFSVGAVALIAALIVALVRTERVRNLVLVIGALVVAFWFSWFALGRSLGDFPDWLRGSKELTSGYTWAMGLGNGPGSGHDWAFLVVLTVILVVGLWQQVRMDGTAAIPTVFLVAVGFWFALKEGFVRLDSVHDVVGFVFLATLIVVVPWAKRSTTVGVVGLACALLAFGIALAPNLGMFNTEVRAAAKRPGDTLLDGAKALRAVVDSGYRDTRLAAAGASLRSAYRVPTSVTSALRGERVQAEPWDIAAVWAYGLPWHPVPVFQSYAAYTPYLDQLNADALQGRNAPSGVLRDRTISLDQRLPAWESPQYMVTMTCRYRVAASKGKWEALRRAGNVCGTPRLIGAASITEGRTVSVPAPSDSSSIVVATFDYPTSALQRLLAIALKPLHYPTVSINGAVHDFVPANAGQQHLIRVPKTLGARQVPNGGLDITRLGFGHADGAVHVQFYEIPTS